MADDKKKKKEQEVPAPEAPKTEAPKTSTASTPKVLGGTTTLDSFAKEDAAEKLEDRSPEVLAKEANHDADTQARLDLISSQNDALAAQKQYDAAEVKGVSDLIRLAEHERETMRANDETARKRENAFRYIVGLGDAISGVANLVGTAHGAANQKQEYNAPRLMEKIEQARAQRTQSMDELNTKLDELRGRERDLKTAGSLREAQLRAAHAKEQQAVRQQQEATAREQAWKQKEYELKQKDAETRRINAEAAETRANTPKSTGKPGEEYSFDLVGGEKATIPGHKWNESTLTSIYAIVPDDMKTKKPKMVRNIAGQNEIAKDESGNTIYVTPSKQEMLNDIVKAAATNQDVADAIKKRAKGTGANDSKWK